MLRIFIQQLTNAARYYGNRRARVEWARHLEILVLCPNCARCRARNSVPSAKLQAKMENWHAKKYIWMAKRKDKLQAKLFLDCQILMTFLFHARLMLHDRTDTSRSVL